MSPSRRILLAVPIYILLSLMIIITTGCAIYPKTTPASPPPAMIDLTKPLKLPGVTVLPPRGERWFMSSPVGYKKSEMILVKSVKGGVPITEPLRTPASIWENSLPGLILSGKLYESYGEEQISVQTVAAMVTTVDLGEKHFETPMEFKEFNEELFKTGDLSSSRHKILDLSVSNSESRGPFCIEYDITAEDRGVPQFPNQVFMLLMKGSRCLHPHWPNYLIDIGYSQRYLKKLGRVLIEGEVRPFLRKFEFTEEKPITVE